MRADLRFRLSCCAAHSDAAAVTMHAKASEEDFIGLMRNNRHTTSPAALVNRVAILSLPAGPPAEVSRTGTFAAAASHPAANA